MTVTYRSKPLKWLAIPFWVASISLSASLKICCIYYYVRFMFLFLSLVVCAVSATPLNTVLRRWPAIIYVKFRCPLLIGYRLFRIIR